MKMQPAREPPREPSRGLGKGAIAINSYGGNHAEMGFESGGSDVLAGSDYFLVVDVCQHLHGDYHSGRVAYSVCGEFGRWANLSRGRSLY
jgi:hypothetical protein